MSESVTIWIYWECFKCKKLFKVKGMDENWRRTQCPDCGTKLGLIMTDDGLEVVEISD